MWVLKWQPKEALAPEGRRRVERLTAASGRASGLLGSVKDPKVFPAGIVDEA
jgi:hypothetical protein